VASSWQWSTKGTLQASDWTTHNIGGLIIKVIFVQWVSYTILVPYCKHYCSSFLLLCVQETKKNKIVFHEQNCKCVEYLLEVVNRASQCKSWYMNEIRLIMLGLIALVFLVLFFYFIDTMNVIWKTEKWILLYRYLLLVIDKRQDRYINGIFTQHKITW
jgi:hypothetical protein